MELIDLSQEIYTGMPVYKSLPEVKISVHSTHEEWEGLKDAKNATPSVFKLEMGEHTGSHVDALSHMGIPYKDHTIDRMPLSNFYTTGICLDLSYKTAGELIDTEELIAAALRAKTKIVSGMTVLLYTDHYRRAYNTAKWPNGPGITAAAARWLGEQKIAAFGVETMSPGIPGKSNKEVHRICGELSFTHYENLINLHLLINRGQFRFIGFPLKIRGGTGSPVRAVALFEK
ncbi:MAG: cyclase family protein [Flavobacteriaceae bacterium]